MWVVCVFLFLVSYRTLHYRRNSCAKLFLSQNDQIKYACACRYFPSGAMPPNAPSIPPAPARASTEYYTADMLPKRMTACVQPARTCVLPINWCPIKWCVNVRVAVVLLMQLLVGMVQLMVRSPVYTGVLGIANDEICIQTEYNRILWDWENRSTDGLTQMTSSELPQRWREWCFFCTESLSSTLLWSYRICAGHSHSSWRVLK